MCLALTIAVPVAAQDPVVIDPIRMDTAAVNVGDPVVLRVGWGACTRGLVVAYTRAAQIEWSVDGSPIPTSPVWTAPVPVAVQGVNTCVNDTLTAWRATALYPTTFETPGTFTVSVHVWTTHILPDGGDYDGDGKPDLIIGGYSASVELTVMEP